MWRKRLLLPAATAAVMAAGVMAEAQQIWQVEGGRTNISLNRNFLADLGLEVVGVTQTAPAMPDMESPIGFGLAPAATLTFTSAAGLFSGWDGGEAAHTGGLTIRSSKGSISLDGFVLTYSKGTDSFYLRTSERNGPAILEVTHLKQRFNRDKRDFVFGYGDVTLTMEGARRLGRPELTGQLLGMITTETRVRQIGGLRDDPFFSGGGVGGDPEGFNNGDVVLHNVSGLTSLGRKSGAAFAFPNGINGLSMSTTSCNIGTVPVNWWQRMDERHPSISMNLYRISNGILQNVGIGWVKHGFLSTNSPGCGSCQQPPFGGAQLGINCTDTYGSGLNGSRTWLGPRGEINPFTGKWTCLGSWFANYQPDCVLRNSSGSGFDGDEHRLRVRDADLNVPGALFVFEAYYVSENDADRYNNIGWRSVDASWSGSQWNFTGQSEQRMGPVLGMPGGASNSWTDMRSFAEPRDEGDYIIGVKAVAQGGGIWHYEYMVYNHTSDRKARQFTVQVPVGATITDVGFSQPRIDGEPVWTHTIGNGFVTWQTETFAQNPNANSIEYHSMYNFRFKANVAPGDAMAALGQFKPGPVDVLSVATRGPGDPGTVLPESFDVHRGILMSGVLVSLFFGEDARLLVRPGLVLGSFEAPIQVVSKGTSPTETPSQLGFTFKGSASATNINQTIHLFNYVTNTWEQVDSRAATTSDSTVNVNISSNASRFVKPGTREMQSRVSFRQTGPVVSYPYTGRLDRAVWSVQ